MVPEVLDEHGKPKDVSSARATYDEALDMLRKKKMANIAEEPEYTEHPEPVSEFPTV